MKEFEIKSIIPGTIVQLTDKGYNRYRAYCEAKGFRQHGNRFTLKCFVTGEQCVDHYETTDGIGFCVEPDEIAEVLGQDQPRPTVRPNFELMYGEAMAQVEFLEHKLKETEDQLAKHKQFIRDII